MISDESFKKAESVAKIQRFSRIPFSPRVDDAPSAACTCGYRICRDIDIAIEYMFPEPGLLRRCCQTNVFGLVLVRVETSGKVVANDGGANLTAQNCVSAQQIRPVWPAWPAYTIDENVRDMVREHYGRDDIYALSGFGLAVERWAEMESATSSN